MKESTRIAILCFHRVLPASRREGPEEPYFQRQTALELERFCVLLDDLAKRDAVLPPELLFAWTNGTPMPSRTGVILTFDDGYADVLEVAAPELRKRGMRALLCVTTAVVEGLSRGFPVDHWYAAVQGATARRGTLEGFGCAPWVFDLDREEDRARLIDGPEKRDFIRANASKQDLKLHLLRRALRVEAPAALPPLLDIAALRTLMHEGFLLGSHGEQHVHLPLFSPEEAANHLSRSRAFFDQNDLGDVRILAYPDGASCPRTEAIAKAAGFTVGLVLGSRFATHADEPLRLPRIIPTNDPTWFTRRLLPLFTAEGR